MAIEPIKKLTVISPLISSKKLMQTVRELGIVHVIDAAEELEEESVHLRMKGSSTEDVDSTLHKIDAILNLLKTYAPEEQGFFQGLAPVPQVIERKELEEAIETYDLDARYQRANELDELIRRNERNRTETEAKLGVLLPLKDLRFKLDDIHGSRRFTFIYGRIPVQNMGGLDKTTYPWTHAAWEAIGEPDEKNASAKNARNTSRILLAVLNDDADDVRDALRRLSFTEVELPNLPGMIEDHVESLEEDLAELGSAHEKIRADINALAPDRRMLVTLKAYWTSHRNEHLAMAKTLGGRWVHLLTGYIRLRDVEKFNAIIGREFPESVTNFEDPAPGENVPVSLSLPKALRPLSLIVEMFGLPPYRSFDPTPFLHINFYIFFGICFSDVGYGLMLIASSLYLIKRTKQYEGVADFGRILLYGGISTVVFGALMGSWFGDLYMEKYLGENNVLMRIQSLFVVIDPISKIIPALLLTLLIGVLNQFYGIGLKMYGALREGDWKTAVFDGIFWYLTLPGLLIVVSKLFVQTPAGLYNTGLVLFCSGVLGLILTQGRDIKNPVGRILGGIVSLYGIIGSYGMTAFIGDVLSYCRLLALGLTTGIVGMTFNMLGGLIKDVPYVGIILFIMIVVVGHLFNFVISLLGAFVHSMRLIFVEFFGRFYDSDARPFQPLGFDSPLCVIKKEDASNG